MAKVLKYILKSLKLFKDKVLAGCPKHYIVGIWEEEKVSLRYFYHWGTPAVHISSVQFGVPWICFK